MANYTVKFENNTAVISNIQNFDPALVFDCGQCFNFDLTSDGGYCGVVGDRVITVYPAENNSFAIYNTDEKSFQDIAKYLCLDDDYSEICNDIIASLESNSVDTSVMKKAMQLGGGIRLMRQDRWETLCSFIISQNNNIPRIKKIIATLKQRYGEYFSFDGKDYYRFPTPQALYSAGIDELFDCKTGFRAKYIYDAAEKVVSGKLDLTSVDNMTTEAAAEELMKIKGVGPKVAACVLLFGYGKKDAFPIDVWVKKVLSKYFSQDFSHKQLGKYAGVAQQYLFYYERYLVSKSEKSKA